MITFILKALISVRAAAFYSFLYRKVGKTMLLVASILSITMVSGQPATFDNYMQQGLKLYDNGDYKAAITQYQQALQIDSTSPVARYEMAFAYYALKEYVKTIEYCDKILKSKTQYTDQAYLLKGSALDAMGKPQEAVSTYTKAIKAYPNNHLLYYNLALTLYNIKGEKEEIEKNLRQALTLNPSHASSHFLLGNLMYGQQQRVQSMLSLYNFLLLEPKGNRAVSAYDLLMQQFGQGIKKEDGKTTILVSDNQSKNQFGAADLALSLMAASNDTNKDKGKNRMELFVNNTTTLFTILGELKKENKSFWWNFYVDFFYDLQNNKLMEPFCYYISQSKQDKNVSTWIAKNGEAIKKLFAWYTIYKRK